MATQVVKKLPFKLLTNGPSMAVVRSKTTSYQYVASRARDPTFEKLMDKHKNLLKAIAIQDLILANHSNNPPSVSLEFLNRLSQKLHLNRGAAAFLRKHPHIFDIFYDPTRSQPFCKLTDTAIQISRQEAAAIGESLPLVIDRLVRILSMSVSKSLPLRAIFKVWREFGLPDDFEDSVIAQNPHLFKLCDAHEPNTHTLKLVGAIPSNNLVASVENWRITECCKEDSSVDRTAMQFSFKHGFPPGMRLSKNFRAKVKEWQKLPYVGPYEHVGEKKRSKSGIEAAAIGESLPLVIDRLVRILSMTVSKSLPLRAIFKVWREFGLPDDFEDSVIAQNPHLFKLCDAHEPNTHTLKLVGAIPSNNLVASVENWRITECCKEDSSVDRTAMQFSFKHGFPPGMRLSKNFRAKVKEWQKLPYVGPYEHVGEKKRSKSGIMAFEKRAVAIVHEFLSLTVEKMVEVEKISHFRKCFGIDLNIRDLFLDHPGIFYLSTKGKRHTVFLREAYERGCLIDPNPVYNVRRKLLDLVVMGRRGLFKSDAKSRDIDRSMEDRMQGEESG